MENLSYRLRNLKLHLKWWNRHIYGNVHTQVDALQKELAKVERLLQARYSDAAWERRSRVRDQLDEVVRQQELFYLQKSRIQWLQEGDRNTRFFHTSVAHRSPTHHESSLTTAIPTGEEIKEVVFSMSRHYAPGPDGFPVDFYVSCWDIVGTDLIKAIKEIFRHKVFTRSWKTTFFALISKVTTPTSFRDFRPISLCNVCYKVVSKIVIRRLSSFFDRLISPEQCRFVKGRYIHDNIMLVHELAQSLGHDCRGSNIIIKLDMEKAFDRIEWSFLIKVLRCFRFTDDFIDLVDACVRENHFSLLVNGSSTPFFTATRGL
ncbi:unnamed protein product [Spirodela intermedia]|uniref:Reverse transcriptase domain-containing protein n=1 Tax=Spirodela intermedia TaxID=51605 RepID=A0A7I8KDQ6_SPIIN|nr:unnamed protein product [Spirodela intermedia]